MMANDIINEPHPSQPTTAMWWSAHQTTTTISGLIKISPQFNQLTNICVSACIEIPPKIEIICYGMLSGDIPIKPTDMYYSTI